MVLHIINGDMKKEEPKKGYESLTASYRYWAEREPGRKDEWKQKYEWALGRAQQYADRLGVTRDEVLAVWEQERDYWYVNYYQESNQPDLTRRNVVTLEQWEAEGERLYGKNHLEWRFRCPTCGHIQTPQEFKTAGIDPHKAYQSCASRYGLGGESTCKWTVCGLLITGGRYVIDARYCPRLIFEFADKKEDGRMCHPDNSLYREYIHYKALEADCGIVSSTTFEEWLTNRRKNK